jgi:FAD/FMN-containing dehydrogenase/Fe-S oxidoreductase
MIPRLNLTQTLNQTLKPDYAEFLAALEKTSFSGEIRGEFASRLSASTDNSIYQILPQAVVFPKNTADLVILFQLANQPAYRQITFSPRGGGTGTNGQSLSPGIMIDCSKYMNQILEVNVAAGWVRVQPGVVLDQLNADLKPFGVFFAPNLAPSNRATIGGMINTDACGKGSRIYGRTSNHILELEWVLPDGTVGNSHSLDLPNLSQIKQQSNRLGEIYRQVDDIVTSKQELIAETFPKLTRFMTGYNLANVYDNERHTFNLNWLLAGSEGTLGVITEAKLKLTPIPKAQGLLVIHYRCFDDALLAAENLLKAEPAAIETIDETILQLAKNDAIYNDVKDFIGDAQAINLVEFVGEMQSAVNDKIEKICAAIAHNKNNPQKAIGYYLTKNAQEAAKLWDLRKKGVGLLGNKPGKRQPIALIEDTAVPPDNLANYIREFKRLLSKYELEYAMYGHVDVGCLHVRPALDMKAPEDAALIRELSDQVVALVRKYGGVMWGEHGKGFRSEYTPLFFGAELYEELRKIKAAFDPYNQLNPGKIVTPFGSDAAVVPLESPLRGEFDRQVSPELQLEYEAAFKCNGNGACFNYDPHQVMCPSAKETRDRIHSPKGRASLLREWLRQLEVGTPPNPPFKKGGLEVGTPPNPPFKKGGLEVGTPPNPPFKKGGLEVGTPPNPPFKKGGLEEMGFSFSQPASFPLKLWNTLQKYLGVYDFSHEVYAGMHGCLSCKACATQCPINVDIPEMKAKFLALYYTRYMRSLRDYFIGYIETLAQWQSFAPGLVNLLTQNPLTLWLIRHSLKMVDPPVVSPGTVQQGLVARKALEFNLEKLANLSESQKLNSVILIQDAFTSFYESDLVLDTYDFLTKLGYTVYVAPFFPSGKPLHVKGFLTEFCAIAHKNSAYFQQIAGLNIPMIGIEPSIVLTYRDEYQKGDRQFIPRDNNPPVQLLQEFLVSQLDRLPKVKHYHNHSQSYQLFGHCTEKTAALASQRQWQQIFNAVGLQLNLVETGCCGMAGIYGHEAEHYAESQGIYQMSWGRQLPENLPDNIEKQPYILATGYSCRSQVKRFDGWQPLHPVQALLKLM